MVCTRYYRGQGPQLYENKKRNGTVAVIAYAIGLKASGLGEASSVGGRKKTTEEGRKKRRERLE